MPRPPNVGFSQWLRQHGFLDRPWVIDAKCGGRQDLPWIADKRPDPHEHLRMNEICQQCPVIASCAGYGLATTGGFYAGVWLPWSETNPNNEYVRYERRRARDELRSIFKLEKQLAQ